MASQEVQDSVYWLAFLTVLLLDTFIVCVVAVIAHARVEKCSWNPDDTNKRLALGTIVASLAVILSLHSLPKLLPTVFRPDQMNATAVAAGIVGGVIGGTIFDPLQWAGWFGFYWAALAIKRKRHYALSQSKARRIMNRIAISVFLGLVFASWIVSLIISKAGFQRTISQHVSRDMIQEAVGKKPDDPSRTPEEKKVVVVSRDILRSIANLKNQHHLAAAHYMQEIAGLYSVSSFSGRGEMERLIKAVAGLNEVDREFDHTLRDFPRKVQNRLDSSYLADSEKKEFLIGFSENFAPTMKATDELQLAEDRWARSTLELYRFASQHSNQIGIAQGQLAIADNNIRDEFNSQLSNCLNLYSELQAANGKLVAIQKLRTQESGITDADLGVKK